MAITEAGKSIPCDKINAPKVTYVTNQEDINFNNLYIFYTIISKSSMSIVKNGAYQEFRILTLIFSVAL